MNDDTWRSAGLGWTPRNIYTLGMLTIIFGLNTVDRSLLGLLAPMIKADLRLSDTAIGLLAGFAFSAFYAITAIPIASLADRSNRRNIIAIGVGFWSMMMVLHAFVASVWQLAVARFLLGAGEATNVAPSNSIIADLFSPAHRPLALGILSSATSIGVLIGFPLLGQLSQEHGWRTAFVAAGVPGIVIAVLLFLTVREPRRVATHASGIPVEKVRLDAALRRLFGTPAFVLAVAAGTFTAMSMGVTLTWVPTFLSRVHGLSQAEIGGFIGALRGFGGLVGALAGGLLATWLGQRDRRWRYRVPALAMLLAAPAQLLMIFGSGSLWRPGLALETMLLMAQFGPFLAILLASSDSRTRSVAVASFLFVSNMFGLAVGPLIAGYISDLLTPTLGVEAIRYALLTGVVATLMAGTLCFAAGRRISRDEVTEVDDA